MRRKDTRRGSHGQARHSVGSSLLDLFLPGELPHGFRCLYCCHFIDLRRFFSVRQRAESPMPTSPFPRRCGPGIVTGITVTDAEPTA
jgi:hypothetical protein